MNWNELKALADKKAVFNEEEPDAFMKEVYRAERDWLLILLAIYETLESENGKVKNSKHNLLAIAGIDGAYNSYLAAVIFPLISNMVTRLNTSVIKTNEYYKTMLQFSSDFEASALKSLSEFDTIYKAGQFSLGTYQATENKVFNTINARLGVSASGKLVKGGFIYNIYHNTSVLDESRELFYKAVVGEMPVKDFKTLLKDSVISLREETGEVTRLKSTGQLAKLYAPLSNDVFAKVDRTASTIIQQDFDLKYFIYGGTIIKKSRPFCILKCNHVYNTEEAKGWPKENPAPIAIDEDTYNPVIDMGGINCRHTPLFISKELYEVLKEEGSDLIPG